MKLVGTLVGIAGVVCLARVAAAVPVHYPIQVRYTDGSIDYDVNGDGAFDIAATHSHIQTCDIPSSAGAYIFQMTPLRNLEFLTGGTFENHRLLRVGLEDEIGPAPSRGSWGPWSFGSAGVWNTWSLHNPENDGYQDDFRDQTEGYIGFRLSDGDGFHYGWLKLELYYNAMRQNPDGTYSPMDPPIYFPGVSIVDGALESVPNAPIAVGTVPEPTMLALAVCGLCGVAIWRRVTR